MKKTYIIPTLCTIHVGTAQLTATSIGIHGTQVTGDNGGWAREQSDFDDFWDED